MPFIQYKCRICDKNVDQISQFKLSGNIIRKLSCGHSQIDKTVLENEQESFENLKSIDGRKLFPFQITGARACEKSNLNFLFADEMGLGKTVQILASLKLHPEAMPVAIICKSALKSQWSIEIARWFGTRTLRYQIEKSNDLVPPGLQFYIFSFDILRRFAKKTKKRNIQGELIESEDYGKLIKLFADLGIKTVVIDECQHIKNHLSTRAKSVRAICEQVPYKLAASGTPIKNHAAEYFPILNILQPQLFNTYQNFRDDWCENYWTGYSYKIGGLKNSKKFEEFTKDFIIRRTRDEVELDFPERNRQYHYYDLGEQVQKAYDETANELSEYMENDSGKNAFQDTTSILGYLNRMRHLTGLSKVDDTIDFLDDFIMSTDRKIVVFVHHIDVGDLIQQKCNKLLENINEMFGKNYSLAYRMLGGQAGKIFEIGEAFQKDINARVLIAPTLAAGEGLNLQTIGDCIIHEREWNPPNEEQAEGRFIRIGATHTSVSCNYMLALGTIDEKFTNIVEKKRAIIANTLDGMNYAWNETDIMKELAEAIVKSANKKKGY